MNILILSCGTRNKIIQYFKRALAGVGNVVATDMSIHAPALYEADRYYIVPSMTSPGYLDEILDICRREKIRGVLSLIDPELALLAQNETKFARIGVQVIGSAYDVCMRAFDKMEMFRWLTEHGYRCARSFTDRGAFFKAVEQGKLTYPVFVKPVCGSASLSVNRAKDAQTVDFLMDHSEGMMVQEYLHGQEIGADVYIDMISGEVVSIFTKKKLLMRAGETDKAVSFKDEKLFDLIRRFVKECGFRGQIDIDLFEINGEYYISEVNPRFGGGYPHAYECGADHIKLICNNLCDNANEPVIGNYETDLVMMKYCEVKVVRDDG